ncbi:hypothetical protein BIU82_13895 [Arthrobacter sp. SW1]|uniref:peptidoglycan-binding domain-containing protein n=1 Tax=Arthrobacter sp. SW1 TaxID=1920889 RepID=UPI000877BB4B|nr:peptidoglycan-binding domain-containing protein [Arthrobacter sp. SW1]OFI39419.1 hypothetical protein BIU82_13895 [Arthrobacter sp. SW1]
MSTVVATRPPGVDRLVVMAPSRNLGDTVTPGELLAVVSDRPLLVLPASVPLYRDLFLGDTGSDVTALQHALTDLGYSSNISGTFDASTQAALEAWYEAVGQTAPFGSPVSASGPDSETSSPAQSEATAPQTQGVVFRWREFVQIPRDSGRIASMASVGTVLGEDGVLARLTIADDTIVARADLLQADAFSVGSLVTVRAGSNTADLKVTSLSAFKDGDPGQNLIPGKDLVIALPPGAKGFSRDQSVTITSGKEASKSLAVPLIAIRQEQGAAFVEVETPEGLKRVEVEVTAQADGWAGIAENKDLPVTTRVRLP